MSEMFPQGWREGKLGQISKLITKGTTPTSVGFKYETSGIRFVKVENIDDDGKIKSNSSNTYISQECHKKLTRSNIEAGDILFSIAGTLGRVGLVSINFGPANTNQAVSIIRIESKKNSLRFLYYWLRGERIKLEVDGLQTVGAQPNLSLAQIGNLPIFLPPLAEQQKIASILTSVDQVIEKTESEISKLQDLKKGMMQQLLTQGIGHTQFKDSPVGRIPVGWEVVTVSDIFEFKNGKAFYADGYSEDGFIVVDLLNISLDGKFRLTPKDKKISLELYEKFPKSHLNKSDIIIIMTDINPDLELIGKTAIIDNNNFYVLNQRVGCLRILNSLDHSVQFHNYLLNSNRIRQQVKTNTLGTAQFYINTPVIKGLQLPIPPLNEQQKIIDILTSIDDSIQQQQRELQQTQNLKKSLMQDLLTGKVRVKVDSDE